jgi:hypothetical protein
MAGSTGRGHRRGVFLTLFGMMLLSPTQGVIPAKAGIQGHRFRRLPWLPAFAGMTVY